MRLRHTLSLLAAATLSAAPAAMAPARAQSAAQYTKTPPPKTRFRAGPLRFSPRLELRNAGKDSNVYLDPDDQTDDTSVVVRGAVEGFVPVRQRLRLYGEGWLDWSYYSTSAEERSTDPGGEGRAELDVGRFTLVGGGGAYQARQIFSIDIDRRTLRQERWAYAGGQVAFSRRFTLASGVEARMFRFDGSGLRAGSDLQTALALNRNAQTLRVEGRYALTPLTTLVGTADRIDDEYAAASRADRTTRSYRYLGGLEFGAKALVVGRVLAGLREIPGSDSGSLPSYRGPAFQADVVLPVRGSGRLTGSLQRDVYASSWSTRRVGGRLLRNAYVLNSARASAEYGLPFDFFGRVSVGFESAEYLWPEPRGGQLYAKVDHLYSAGATLLRTVSGNLRVGGAATYYRRVSTWPGSSYDRWVFGVSAELAP